MDEFDGAESRAPPGFGVSPAAGPPPGMEFGVNSFSANNGMQPSGDLFWGQGNANESGWDDASGDDEEMPQWADSVVDPSYSHTLTGHMPNAKTESEVAHAAQVQSLEAIVKQHEHDLSAQAEYTNKILSEQASLQEMLANQREQLDELSGQLSSVSMERNEARRQLDSVNVQLQSAMSSQPAAAASWNEKQSQVVEELLEEATRERLRVEELQQQLEEKDQQLGMYRKQAEELQRAHAVANENKIKAVHEKDVERKAKDDALARLKKKEKEIKELRDQEKSRLKAEKQLAKGKAAQQRAEDEAGLKIAAFQKELQDVRDNVAKLKAALLSAESETKASKQELDKQNKAKVKLEKESSVRVAVAERKLEVEREKISKLKLEIERMKLAQVVDVAFAIDDDRTKCPHCGREGPAPKAAAGSDKKGEANSNHAASTTSPPKFPPAPALSTGLEEKLKVVGLWTTYCEAQDAYGEGKLEEATKKFKDLVDRQPQSHELQVSLAYSHIVSSDHAAAEACLRDALTICPNHVEALLGLGQIYFERCEYARSREQIVLAIKADPGHLGALRWLAELQKLPKTDTSEKATSTKHTGRGARKLDVNPIDSSVVPSSAESGKVSADGLCDEQKRSIQQIATVTMTAQLLNSSLKYAEDKINMNEKAHDAEGALGHDTGELEGTVDPLVIEALPASDASHAPHERSAKEAWERKEAEVLREALEDVKKIADSKAKEENGKQALIKAMDVKIADQWLQDATASKLDLDDASLKTSLKARLTQAQVEAQEKDLQDALAELEQEEHSPSSRAAGGAAGRQRKERRPAMAAQSATAADYAAPIEAPQKAGGCEEFVEAVLASASPEAVLASAPPLTVEPPQFEAHLNAALACATEATAQHVITEEDRPPGLDSMTMREAVRANTARRAREEEEANAAALAAAKAEQRNILLQVDILQEKTAILRPLWPQQHWDELDNILDPIMQVARKHPSRAGGALQWATILTDWLLKNCKPGANGQGGWGITKVKCAAWINMNLAHPFTLYAINRDSCVQDMLPTLMHSLDELSINVASADKTAHTNTLKMIQTLLEKVSDKKEAEPASPDSEAAAVGATKPSQDKGSAKVASLKPCAEDKGKKKALQKGLKKGFFCN